MDLSVFCCQRDGLSHAEVWLPLTTLANWFAILLLTLPNLSVLLITAPGEQPDSYSMPWNKPVEKEKADMQRKDWVLWSHRIFLRFPSYFQLQNLDLPIILLSVLDPWILMYMMNAMDKPR